MSDPKVPMRKRPENISGFWGKAPEERRRLQVQYEEVPINSLKEWKDNPRLNEDAIPRLMRLIKEHGFAGVVIATPDGTLRAGHTRWRAARRLGHQKIWVHWKNFPSVKAAEAYALSDNKSQEWSEWDYTKLARLFKSRISVDVQKLSGFTHSQISWGGVAPIDVEKIPDLDSSTALHTLRIDGVKGVHVKVLAAKIERLLVVVKDQIGESYELRTY